MPKPPMTPKTPALVRKPSAVPVKVSMNALGPDRSPAPIAPPPYGLLDDTTMKTKRRLIPKCARDVPVAVNQELTAKVNRDTLHSA